jgi:hypothetical protein
MFNDEKTLALRERNEIRMKEFKEKMGVFWLLHPENSVKIKKEVRVLS